MDVWTRVKRARFSEKIRKHPEVAQTMGITSDLLPKPAKSKSFHGEPATMKEVQP